MIIVHLALVIVIAAAIFLYIQIKPSRAWARFCLTIALVLVFLCVGVSEVPFLFKDKLIHHLHAYRWLTLARNLLGGMIIGIYISLLASEEMWPGKKVWPYNHKNL